MYSFVCNICFIAGLSINEKIKHIIIQILDKFDLNFMIHLFINSMSPSNGICLVWLQIKLEDTHWSYPKRMVTLLNGYIHFHFVLWISGIACHRKHFLQEQLTLLSHIWMIQIGMWKNSIQRSAQLSILKVYVYFIREESTEVACRLNFPLKDKGRPNYSFA
jgi:hypothetical protein